MSTAVATSSPSPATSPHPFTTSHPSPRHSLASSPRHHSPAGSRPSPRFTSNSTTSSSPRRPFNAPSSAHNSPNLTRQQQHFVESGPVARSFQGYASRGTQYSPDGYPPTTGRKVAADAGRRPPAEPTTTRKRKEAVSSDSSEGSMSSATSASSSGAYRPSTVLQQPDEPQPRVDPARASARGDGADSSHESELQEARSTHGHSAAPKRSRPEPGSLQVMPNKYETASPKDLGILIANMLMELIRINDQIPLRDGRLTRFHSRAPPGISVSDYLQRLITHATLSPPILLSMVYYIDRLCTMYPAFTINSLTVHRFLITAATVAAKGLSDSFWTNPTYARIGGIPVSELATLELEFLQRVDWKIVPKPEVLVDYYASLVDRTDGYTLEQSSSGSDTTSLDESDVPTKSSEELVDEDKKDDEMGG